MRLFAAIPLPPEVAARASALLPARPELRPVRAEQLHLTLAFLGDVPPPRLADAVSALGEAARDAAPFALTLDRLGRFPERGSPHTIWLGVGAGAEEATRLADRVRSALAPRDLPFDRKPFRAHVTLARVREDAGHDAARELAALLERTRVAPLAFPAEVAVLFESVLSPKGARYTPRSVAPLGGGEG